MASENSENTEETPDATPQEDAETSNEETSEVGASEVEASEEQPAEAGDETPAGEPAAAEPAAEDVEPAGAAEVAAEAESSAGAAAGLTLGSGPPEEGEEEEASHAAPVIRGKVDRFGVAMGTGRRKTSVARIRVREGNGQLTINGRPLDDYFRVDRDRQDVLAPLVAADCEGKVDVWVRVKGGGTTGQAGAIVLGIARALQVMDASLHQKLSDGGFLTRDGRMVERKKYGFKKARKSFQFSKR